MQRGWVQELQSTWLLSWSTWLLRSWSWLGMLQGITKSLALSQGIFSWPSGWFKPNYFSCIVLMFIVQER